MIEKLREYGLNKYESMAYLCLIQIGLSTSPTISKISKVPYGRIYSILSSLESKGFIKVYQGKPKKYIAIQPSIILNNVINTKTIELKKIKQQNLRLIQNLETIKKEKPSKPLEIINIIQGKRNTLNLSIQLHKKAIKEWKTIHRLPIYEPHIKAYKEMIKRGVNTKVLTHITPGNKENLKIWKKLKIKIRNLESPQSWFTIIDNSDIVLRISGPEIGGYISLHIQNPALANTLSTNFNNLWKKAKKI